MRIGIDVQATRGQRTGIGVYADRLLRALLRVAPQHEYVPLSWEREGELRTDQRLRWQQWLLPRRARAAGVDLLHVPGFDAPRWRPCPVVLTVHDLIGLLFPEQLPPISRLYWAWWLPRSLCWADHLIADSSHTARDLERRLGIPPERITVIPLGVDERFHPEIPPEAREAARRKYGLAFPVILYVGTLGPRKGLDTLVAAFGRIAGRIPHHLVLAGKPGWWVDRLLREIRALGLTERVHLLGYVPEEDLPALYRLADVFAYPSRYEGFGLPPLEAMACGTPCGVRGRGQPARGRGGRRPAGPAGGSRGLGGGPPPGPGGRIPSPAPAGGGAGPGPTVHLGGDRPAHPPRLRTGGRPVIEASSI